jgi:hypothetical protein
LQSYPVSQAAAAEMMGVFTLAELKRWAAAVDYELVVISWKL